MFVLNLLLSGIFIKFGFNVFFLVPSCNVDLLEVLVESFKNSI